MKRNITLLVLFFVFCGAIFAKFHPGIKWREISDKKFIVIFPKGYASEAFYTLDIARDIYNKLENLWAPIHGNPAAGEAIKGLQTTGPAVYDLDKKKRIVKNRIRIVLIDSYDYANGSATFFPFNWIEIYLFNPAPDSAIGGCRDWIYMVLSHEMNHIFEMNEGSGFTYFMRRLMGSHPVFFPMIYAPIWWLEGTAVYAESQLSPGGRLDTPDFSIMLENIAAAGKVPDSARIYGEPTTWPGPTAKYLYGAKFVRFLVDRYGEHKVRELVHSFGYHFVPLLISPRFKRVFGKGLNRLWDEFIESIERREKRNLMKGKESKIKALTQNGLIKKYPLFGPDKKIFYVDQNYKEFPGIYELDPAAGKSRRLIKKTGINSLYYSKKDRKIYFSAFHYFKTYYRYSDLYEFDIKKKKLRRLSKGRRLAYPVKIGDDIYCVKRVRTKSFLAALNLKNGKERILSRGFDSLAQISLSPDKKTIAASLKENNKSWSIALFTLEGELLRVLTDGDRKSFGPQWKDSENIYFITEEGNHYRLASYHLPTGKSYIHRDHFVPDIQYFSFHPNSEQLLVSFFDANGFNLGLLKIPSTENSPPAANFLLIPCKSLLKKQTFSSCLSVLLLPGPNWVGGATPFLKKVGQKLLLSRSEAQDDDFSSSYAVSAVRSAFYSPLTGEGKQNAIKIKKYRLFRELFPKYFSVNYRDAGGEFQPGIYLSGNDALEKHSFTLETFYGFRSNSLNLNFNYTYDGWYPTLLFNFCNYTDTYQDQDKREYNHLTQKIELAGLLPLSFNEKRQTYLYSSVYFEKTTDRFDDPAENMILNLNGIGLAYLFSSLKKYYDSISYSDGLRFSLSYAREFKFMGSDYDINTLALEYQQFLSLFRPNVFALRFAVSDSWGEARRIFYMGGAESKDAFSLAGSNMFSLMRGFPKGFFYGYGGFILTVEYRISLFKIERVFAVFRAIDRLYLTLFSDIGNLWRKDKKINPAYSFGMELNLVAYIGDEKFDFSGGVAIGHHPYHVPVFYIRLGRSF